MSYPLKTASVEILEGNHSHVCDYCAMKIIGRPVPAKYNVFDGNGVKYACGLHIAWAIRVVATRKGG